MGTALQFFAPVGICMEREPFFGLCCELLFGTCRVLAQVVHVIRLQCLLWQVEHVVLFVLHSDVEWCLKYSFAFTTEDEMTLCRSASRSISRSASPHSKSRSISRSPARSN